MNDQQFLLSLRLTTIAQHELDDIRAAVKHKDLAFARVLFARLQTDLALLYSLIDQPS